MVGLDLARCTLCTLVPVASGLSCIAIVIMARMWWVLLSVVLLAVFCVVQMVFVLLGQNAQPASLIAYPDRDTIHDAVYTDSNRTALPPKLPLRTKGRYIVDDAGMRFKLVSVNWYGASDILQIPGGLDVQHRDDIARTIRSLGFNSVRLPYADEMVTNETIVDAANLAANADLVGSRGRDIFAAVIRSLTDAGLAVIVNNHITQARWCCDLNPCDCQWRNNYLPVFCAVRQSEDQWIENWISIMLPHVDDPLVIGVDLRNEVRGLSGKYLWNSWADAAEKAAERLLELQPNWLMFVEGVQSANTLSGARSRPVRLSIPHRVVYSSHVYGWSGWGSLSPYWRRKPESFNRDMDRNWAYLLDEDIAPVWVGEFGAPDQPNTGDLHYWTMLMDYLRNKDADFGYWALNPRKPGSNEWESYGLLEDDWKTVRLDYRLFDMTKLRQSQSSKSSGDHTTRLGTQRQ